MSMEMNARETVLDILLAITEKEVPSHIALGEALAKYQFLPKADRAFITRVTEGTLEYRIQIDYFINSFSKIEVEKMKAPVREILRSAVYQLKYMDSVPDSAVCNEAVKLTQKRGFYNLKPFVNGVLRTIARELKEFKFPSYEEDPIRYYSIRYSMPEFLVKKWIEDFGEKTTEIMLQDFLKEKPTVVRCTMHQNTVENTIKSLEAQGVTVKKGPYLPYALEISDYNHLMNLNAFVDGRIQVQDVSSMLVAEAADPKKGDYIIDMCAAPGGKSMHLADKMQGYGTVDARDVSERKVNLIRDNAARLQLINVQTKVSDGTIFDVDSEMTADIVIADVPCSGFGVIGKKPDIKYRMDERKQEELIILQRAILDKAIQYVKPRGTLIFSTCTISKEENENNMMWILQNYPFKLESLDPVLPEELHCESTHLGYLQLLPGVHKCDGFFLAKFRRK